MRKNCCLSRTSFNRVVLSPNGNIQAYRNLHDSFTSSAGDRVRPLRLLYGPRQFGKTTIAFRLWSVIINNDPSIAFVNHSLSHVDVRSEETFWFALSRHVYEPARSQLEFEDIIRQRRQRLCLVIDEMDAIFINKDLTSSFMTFFVAGKELPLSWFSWHWKLRSGEPLQESQRRQPHQPL